MLQGGPLLLLLVLLPALARGQGCDTVEHKDDSNNVLKLRVDRSRNPNPNTQVSCISNLTSIKFFKYNS